MKRSSGVLLHVTSLPSDYGIGDMGSGAYEFRNGRDIATQIAALTKLPHAVFAVNDMTAIGIIQKLSELSVRVPEDISVAGFDNIETASMVTPSLTTADQRAYEAGFHAVNMLIDDIEEVPQRTPPFSVTPSFIERSSTAQRRG